VTTPVPVGDAGGVSAYGAGESPVLHPATAPVQITDHLIEYLTGITSVVPPALFDGKVNALHEKTKCVILSCSR